jgi:hypothetical protein
MRKLLVGAALTVVATTAVAAGGQAAKPTTGAGLYPNLVSLVPHHFTVQNDHQREFLRFSNGVANVGAGALRLRPESDAATGVTTGFQEIYDAAGNLVRDEAVSSFEYHPQHNHWHIDAVALFELHEALDDGRGGAMGAVAGGQSVKTTFCLIDWIKLDDNSKTPERTYWDCFPDAVQGISVGWIDQYHHSLEGQELELTGLRPGVYYLLTKANPDSTFLEQRLDDNTAWTSIRLSRDSKGNAKIAAIAHSPCTGGLCGEQLQNR